MSYSLFKKDSKGIIWNNNAKAIQRMLDYDYLCKRKTPSIAAIIHTTSSSKFQKFFFGNEEILIPIYSDPEEAYKQHTDCDVLLNYASFRSAYHATQTALKQENIKTIMITAEGIPERLTRQLIQQAKMLKKPLLDLQQLVLLLQAHLKREILVEQLTILSKQNYTHLDLQD